MALENGHISLVSRLINDLDSITSRFSLYVCVVVIAIGCYYQLSSDIYIKNAIYRITGWIFWKNLYVAGTLALVALASMSRIDSLAKNKPYVQKDKLEILKRFYADNTTRSYDKVLAIIFSLSFFGFSLSFCAEMCLSVIKSFLLKTGPV